MNKIGIDVGATATRIGLFDNENKVLKIETFATDVHDFSKELSQIKEIINQMEEKFGLVGSIGIASPGPLDLTKGMIMKAPNLIGWRNLEIVKEFEKAFPKKMIFLDNDANVAAFGQYLTFKPLPVSLYYVTVSSGVGSGFVYEGNIYHGYNGTATEIFNSLPTLEKGINPSESGIEYFTSGKNIPRVLKSKGVEVKDAQEAFSLRETNPIVKDYFKDYQKRMASFLATAIYFYDPQYIVIGGGVALHNQAFFEEIFTMVYEITSHLDHKTTLKFATKLDEMTLIGAANLH